MNNDTNKKDLDNNEVIENEVIEEVEVETDSEVIEDEVVENETIETEVIEEVNEITEDGIEEIKKERNNVQFDDLEKKNNTIKPKYGLAIALSALFSAVITCAITLLAVMVLIPRYQDSQKLNKEISDYKKTVLAQEAFKEVKTEAKQGDRVKMDFVGYLNDVAFENGAAEDFELVIGSNRFIEGFEPQLVGHKAGEKFDIMVTFPAEYQEATLAGKEVKFSITLKKVESPDTKRKFDDAFVKELAAKYADFKDIKSVKDSYV